jgi:diguanylate cyclase (GGDEF)-like protein/PAS domain S-box-containing protein
LKSRFINIKNINIIILLIIALFISFHSNFDTSLEEFEENARTRENLLREHIKISSSFIKNMSIYGSLFFENEDVIDNKYFSLLTYEAESNTFSLESIKDTQHEKNAGNITGLGQIPEKGIVRDEINLALQYNNFFCSHYEKYPDVAWLYYTSESNFINIFPWVSSKDFKYSENLKTVDFFKVANPENNPQRKIVWTSVYVDHAGKGLMITLSAPVYDNDTFKGVVSLDLTNLWLNNIINSNYDNYLINETDTILATSSKSMTSDQISKIYDLSEVSKNDAEKMKTFEKDTVHRLGGYYFYAASFDDAPWNLFFRVPVWKIAVEALVTTFPILVISLLLLISIQQVHERKRSELEVKKERELFKTTLFSINEGIIVTDSNGKITLMNKIAEQSTGWRKQQAFGQDFQNVFDSINISTGIKSINPVKYVLEKKKNFDFEQNTALISSSGSEIYIRGSAAGIISDDNSLTGVVVSFKDMTVEYEQEKEIEEFLNMNMDMLCFTDTEGIFHRINKKFEDVLGYKAEDLYGKSIFSFMHTENSDNLGTNTADEYRIPSDFISRFLCKDGSYKYIEWHTQPSIGKYIYYSARDISKKVATEKRLREDAFKDQLTGINNRRLFDTIIDNEIEISEKSNKPLSMILLDLDNFKIVNDTYGHPVGDELLRQSAQTVSGIIRNSDIFVRYGGEEFVILMSQTSEDGAVLLAEKIRAALEEKNFPVAGRQTASFGVAVRMKGEPFEDWYKRLDKALYKAKRAGRNKVVADGSME